MKRRQYTLAFTSAGAQAQTYHVSFETLAECQRWHRQASTVRPWELRSSSGGGYGLDKGFLMQACYAGRDEARMLEKTHRMLFSCLQFLPAQDYRDFLLACSSLSAGATMFD